MVAQEQQDWAKAEHYYRESLALKERIGLLTGINGASTTCNQLAMHTLAEGVDRNSALLILRVLETLEDDAGVIDVEGRK